MQITFERLETWPETPTAIRTSSARFKATYQTVRADLEQEIDSLDAYNVLLEADIIPQGISKSGWPFAGTRARSFVWVRLSFTVGMGTGPTRLEFACDQYDSWLGNLRGISLTLSALRDIRRHGATRNSQQYAGFRKALPGGTGTGAGASPQSERWGPEHAGYAADVLVSCCIMAGRSFDPEAVLQEAQAAQAAYRCAAKHFHPDNRATGDAVVFLRLGKAIETLREAQGK